MTVVRAAVFDRQGNLFLRSYLQDPISDQHAARYSITGQGDADLFRDLIVLKHATAAEKGVILLKYAQTFDATASIFDLRCLMVRYHIVLEPCWAGVCDPSILMYLSPGYPVFVQTFTEHDYRFIKDIGFPFVPLRLGPADWVNADIFHPDPTVEKRYDLVMVANWATHKRHSQLFRSLRKITDREISVLLIGFPWGGRTADHIRQDAASLVPDNVKVDVIENIPPKEVARYVNACRIFVFLSRKEGDNKALVEAMFVDVPAIVYAKTIGGASSRINSMTGVLSSDEDLTDTILFMLDHLSSFRPREWALTHTGSAVATEILNSTIRDTAWENGQMYGEDIVEKVNSPNLDYRDPAVRVRFKTDYEFIRACRRRAAGAGARPS